MQDDAISCMATETEQLIAQVAEDDGTSQVFLVDNKRAAILTITPFEIEASVALEKSYFWMGQ
jgi:hypothetical protein